MRTQSAPSRRSQSGFTLVELVVVMSVLVVLSGIVLPKLDVFKLKANKASAASNIHGVDRFIASFKVQRDVFPDQFDSLLDVTAPTTLFTSLDPQLLGVPAGNPKKLATTTIATAEELRSLNRVGLLNVHDHDATISYKGDSGAGTATRLLAINSVLATIDGTNSDGQAIIEHFYPGSGGVVPAGKKLAVFGIGPRNEMIGDLLHVAPFYANTDQNRFYNRFLVVFEFAAGTSGSRARLLGCLGADGDTLTEEVIDFYEK